MYRLAAGSLAVLCILSGHVATAAGEGYLGVHVVAPPPAVAKQLKLDQRGLMVQDIVKDSPAHRAGLQRYDILVRINDEKVGRDPQQFAETIGKMKPGAKLTLKVLRGGRPMELKVKLGDREDAKKGRWLYERKRKLGRLRRLRQDDIPVFKALLAEDDQVVIVERYADGSYEVRKREKDEEQQHVKRYGSAEDFSRSDPQTYRRYRDLVGDEDEQAGRSPWMRRRGPEPFDRPLLPMPELPELDVYKRHVERQLDQLRERIGELEEQLRHRGERILDEYWPAVQERLRRFLDDEGRADREGIEFDVEPDGTIHVEIRRDGLVLNRTFSSADQMAAEAPLIHEEYQSLLRHPE